ncbi:hypothetical protein NEUTE1DRAFT_145871 [Neurospora tetrasperma FGSC 2508]|uniref:Uncharacterized protein n=1 Tax=Neurospora tetrasperma (strain FGSC 2508 / ATCC MYA-4615 / P0657) TaxID=510951 RepID=F8MJK0_NEUT8|nr:uncharacterized protein NEUTE1DRAFT_145871 [Neurospora tetrasperma FGSC 2508]EGO59991.1 hypothetical protein NEUTE1DRAFT_145871 [Neurospora tetrasperma FGSC 2508]EGZ74142.1 hypothetical protein NEUTE2DRAFT_166196 [Neurospora tetrasperma FGSC 2509]
MNNSDTSPGASTPHTSPNSTIAIPTGSSSSKTNTISIGPNRRHTQQDSSTSPYDSDMDLAVHGLHIVDSSHLYPGYKPRQRNAAPHYFHHGSADKMSSTTTTPSPPRSQYRPPLSSMNNSSHSNSSSPSEKVPRKWGVRSYPSLKQRVREERDVRDVRRSTKEGRTKDARLQIGSGRGYNHDEDDRDIEMVDMDVSSGSGSHNWKDAREFERGYDGDTEMGDVPPPPPPPPSSSHEVKGAKEAKGASCSGSNGSKGGCHGRRRVSEMPVKYVQTEGGNTDKSTTSTGSKKRARCSDQMDEEEEKVEHKRMRSSCESRQ